MLEEKLCEGATTMDDKALEPLLGYVNALLEDPGRAELDLSRLPGEARPLAERLVYLGACVQEGRVFAEDLARGDLEAISSQYTNHENPLIPSLESVRKSLAQFLALGTSFVSSDRTTELEGQGEYIEMLNRMIGEVRQRHIELEKSANTDPLTGVGNRRHYERTLEALWEFGEPFTVAFIDIDHLKRCNDHYGHDEGNHYIQQTTLLLKLRRHGDEEVFRIGGDEFVFVSTHSSEHELARRLEECREQLISQSSADGRMTFSFSYGCSRVDPAAGDSQRQMIADADRKMYRYKLMHSVKQEGENGGADGRRGARDDERFDNPFGIDEHIFEALAMTSEGRYFFVCDMDRDESLWSSNAVRDFDLPSTHMSRAGDAWLRLIHPDDRVYYEAEVSRVFAGETHRFSMQYRVLDAQGDYVVCEGRGFRLDATGRFPALFVGTITNRSIAESTDPATSLVDIHGLVIAIASARHLQRPTGLVGVKLYGLAQVNATYGYETGDALLAAAARRLAAAARGAAAVPYRSRGTQFVIVGANLTPQRTEQLCHEVSRELSRPVRVSGHELRLEHVEAWSHYDEVSSQPFAVLSELSTKTRAAWGDVSTAKRELVAVPSERVDALTGLRSGQALLERASKINMAASGTVRCLVTVDLSNLRLFNEWYGVEAGNRLLAEIGGLLADLEERGGILAGYWGQDDFCLYLPFDRVLIDDVYGRMRRVVARHDDSPGFSPSFGVYPVDPRQPVTIDDYSKALFANKQSKGDFKNRVSFFEPVAYAERSHEHQLLSSFQYSIVDGGIFFALQPQCDLVTGKIVGAEALVRWVAKDGTRLSPAEFIPVLEKNGFIVTLDKRVWSMVARWLADAIARGIVPVPVSINVSRIDILAFDVPEFLRGLIEEHHLPPHLLEVEITETAYMQDEGAMEAFTRRLREMGMTVLMDDFGTGRSSLSMLGDVSVDVIKLDRQFLPSAGASREQVERDESIMAGVIDMGHALDLPLVVEGVETEAQARLALDLGARYVQGFYCYRPMPAQEFETLLADAAKTDLAGMTKPSERGALTPPHELRTRGGLSS